MSRSVHYSICWALFPDDKYTSLSLHSRICLGLHPVLELCSHAQSGDKNLDRICNNICALLFVSLKYCQKIFPVVERGLLPGWVLSYSWRPQPHYSVSSSLDNESLTSFMECSPIEISIDVLSSLGPSLKLCSLTKMTHIFKYVIKCKQSCTWF